MARLGTLLFGRENLYHRNGSGLNLVKSYLLAFHPAIMVPAIPTHHSFLSRRTPPSLATKDDFHLPKSTHFIYACVLLPHDATRGKGSPRGLSDATIVTMPLGRKHELDVQVAKKAVKSLIREDDLLSFDFLFEV